MKATAEVSLLTESQRSLLLIDRMVSARHMYNLVMEIELAPKFGVNELREALATLLEIQPGLRQTFADLPRPHAVLNPCPSPEEIVVDIERIDDLPQLVAKTRTHEFDLYEGPLYRFAHLSGDGRSVLLLVVHHLIFDGMSVRPLTNDLTTALSGGFSADERTALRTRREADFQRELAAQVRVEADPKTVEKAAEWARELRERSTAPLYPRPHRPAETSFEGTRVDWVLDADESAAIDATCRDLKITAYEFFTAVYGAVIGRHSATSSAVLGSPFAARRTIGSFDLCGFFVNTLPIHFDVDWTRPFADHASTAVRPAVEQARSRVGVPFSKLVAHLRPDRSTNRNPLFSCMLAMQDTLPLSPDAPVRSLVEHGNGTAKFDLWLGVWPVDGRWRLAVEYDHELLPAPVADEIIGSLRTAIVRAATTPDTPVGALFEDRSRSESSRTDEEWAEPPSDSLVEWVDGTAAGTPHAAAVETADRTITYAELVTASRRTAGGLAQRGVGAGDIVGVCAQDLVDTTVAILAILRRGAAYLPLDATLPSHRLQYMIDKTRCELVIGELDVTGPEFVTIGDLDAEPVADDKGSSAYVMFSSGSTGSPKGIEMGVGPLVNLTAWQIAALEMDASTRFVQYAPLGFDVSFQEIIPTLAAGGTVISRDPVVRADFPALVERLAATATTHVYLPVAALGAFVRAAQDEKFTDLRYVCVSGEQLVLDDVSRDFFVQRPHLTLVNLYGPTETHAVTTHRLGAADAVWPVHVPIGVPLTGVVAYVVDVTGHLAPAGVQGELLLGGRCPAKGYIGDPELTERGFVPDRFAGNGTTYRTGDQVLRDEHGVLVFLGRTDEQVKIRGYRVELGEVEAAANDVPGVRRAVAAPRETDSGRELVLFLVGDADPAAVKERLTGRLPGYAVPARVFVVDAVPYTSNGKVDRTALLRGAEDAIAAELVAAAGQVCEYLDDVERELAEMWSELLEQPNVERERSLLEYGAHSLQVFTALARVRQRYGVTVPVKKFFRGPTVAALAETVRHAAS
ncbi:non-ribosomal peptide synthetase [Lentzea aerocolonigenes]|uniref:non-ribosomal peptide synthetase n=1 Tax=Lentzea aerocolonigenes TaxID=68170 RepID=UPI0004C352B9|nr:amino acid adenylation domain-containing protein [Lentzea aerocolonigenes]MCP2243441.1 amino acid adenylation domain-containing protein [Lentzea aerocolonigenes]